MVDWHARAGSCRSWRLTSSRRTEDERPLEPLLRAGELKHCPQADPKQRRCQQVCQRGKGSALAGFWISSSLDACGADGKTPVRGLLLLFVPVFFFFFFSLSRPLRTHTDRVGVEGRSRGNWLSAAKFDKRRQVNRSSEADHRASSSPCTYAARRSCPPR